MISRNEEGVWCLADLESANGTILNEAQVTTAPLQK